MSNRIRFGAVARAWLLISLFLAPAAGAFAETPAVEKAREYMDAGEIRTAVITLKNRLQEKPEDAEARLLLGRIYLGMRDFPAAEKELERARDLGAPRAKWLAALAETRLRQGRLEQALDLLKPAEGDSAELKAKVAVQRGNILVAQGQVEKAEKAYDLATRHVEGFLPAQLGRARLALEEGEEDRAGTLLQRIREQDPEMAEAWLLTGQLRFHQDDAERAVGAYERAVELDPQNPRAALGLAAARLAVDETAGAREVVQGWLDKGTRSPRFRLVKAVIALRQGRDDEARSILESLVARHNLPPAHLHLGRLAFQDGRYETAVHHLRRYRERHPDKMAPAKLLAAAWLRKDAPERAVKVLAPLRQVGKSDPQFLALLGRSRIAAGKVEPGFQDLREAARIAPKDEGIRAQVALGYMAGDRSAESIPELEQVIHLNPGKTGARYMLALNHLRGKDYGKAASVAQELIRREPQNPVGHNLLALALWGQGMSERAREAFRRALDRVPDFQAARLNLARMDLQAGKSDLAKARFRKVLEQEPENRAALLGMAGLARRRGDAQSYGQWLERAWSAHQPDRAIGLKLVRFRAGQGELLPALRVARHLRQAHPSDARVFGVLGRIQRANGNLTDAATAFQRRAELKPDYPEVWVTLARVYRAQDRPADAKENLEKALGLNPDHRPALLHRARLALDEGEPQRALELARRLRSASPHSPLGPQLAGQAHQQSGDREAARRAYRAALDRGGTRRAALGLFQILRAEGQAGEAEAVLKEWLENQPADVEMRVLLARFRQAHGDLAAAIRSYEKALGYAPERPTVLNNLAWLYLQKGDRRALEYARKAHELAPDRPEITDTYGWAQVRTGNPRKGLRLLKNAAVYAPHIPSIRYHLASALAKLGREGEARRELQRLLETRDEFPEAAKARKLLDSL